MFPSHQHQNISPTTTTSRTDFNNAGEEEKDNQKEQDQHFHSTFFGEQSGGNEANTVNGMITRNTASNTPEFHPAPPPTDIPSIVATPCFSSTSSSSRFLHDRISRKRRRRCSCFACHHAILLQDRSGWVGGRILSNFNLKQLLLVWCTSSQDS